MQHVVPLKTDHTLPPELLLEQWRVYLQEYDHSNGTVKKYTVASTGNSAISLTGIKKASAKPEDRVRAAALTLSSGFFSFPLERGDQVPGLLCVLYAGDG